MLALLLVELFIYCCRLITLVSTFGNHTADIANDPYGFGKHENFKKHYIALEKNLERKMHTLLPVVLIRDPFRWMHTMYKHHYQASLSLGKESHHPALVPTDEEIAEGFDYRAGDQNNSWSTFPVVDQWNNTFDSLADYWSEWNSEFFRETYMPRLMIRFEDTLYHAEAVHDKIQECLFGKESLESDTKPFQYHSDSTKPFNPDLAQTLIKYGTEEGRYANMTFEDLEYANEALASDLMSMFHYPAAPKLAGTDEERLQYGLL